MNTNIPQLYHPTTIVLIDDDLDAINNYTLSLPTHFSIKAFSAPEEALAYINSQQRIKPLNERCQVLVSDINYFEKELTNPQRFEETHIVVSDYAMPGMNGIEFFKKVENPNIYKILLTGIADEKIAVDAFNNDIIHRFFAKQDREVLRKLSATLELVQKNYFNTISNKVSSQVQYATPTFLNDSVFLEYFEQLLVKKNICEYYLSYNPSGFLLISEDGDISRLVIYTQNDLKFQYEMAVSRHAPPELLTRLQPSIISHIPYFGKLPFGIYNNSCTNWEDYFYPAGMLKGQELYYCSLIDAPEGYEELTQNFIGFFDYLEQLES